jgi:teichuronic acid biosynthesis glycosyltransferase TuaC
MRVLWIHNYYQRNIGMFMWDVHGRLNALENIFIDETSIPVVRSFDTLKGVLKIQLNHNSVDIVHAQCGALVGIFAGRAKAAYRITSYRGSDIYWKFGSIKDRFTGFLRCILSWWSGLRSHAIVVMSDEMRKKVLRWPFFRKIHVHVIVDPAGALYWPESCNSIMAELLSHRYQILIANYINHSPIKRTRIIADAVSLCQSAKIQVDLQALSGHSREVVKEAIIASDCVAIASTHEGWPNIIKEALLMGKPFVATDVSDLQSFAASQTYNHIVPAHPLDFACAWVDQIAAKILRPYGISPDLAQFHPDVSALKHILLYNYYGKVKG